MLVEWVYCYSHWVVSVGLCLRFQRLSWCINHDITHPPTNQSQPSIINTALWDCVVWLVCISVKPLMVRESLRICVLSYQQCVVRSGHHSWTHISSWKLCPALPAVRSSVCHWMNRKEDCLSRTCFEIFICAPVKAIPHCWQNECQTNKAFMSRALRFIINCYFTPVHQVVLKKQSGRPCFTKRRNAAL